MSEDVSVLKTVILKENSSAYFIHCFAHRLQLTLVAVSSNDFNVGIFLTNLPIQTMSLQDLVSIKKIPAEYAEAIALGETFTGLGENQEICLKHTGDRI